MSVLDGKGLKRLRQRFNLKQSAFAERVNVSKSFISKLERGKKNMPDDLEQTIRNEFKLNGGLYDMEAKIDFLRIRFKINDPFLVIKNVLRMDKDYFIHKNYGFYRYTETYQFSDIFVYHNPASLDMGVMIELKGKGCREFELILEEYGETWTDFFYHVYDEELFKDESDFYPTVDTKITRIDIALDELVSPFGDNYSLYELKEKMERELVDADSRDYSFTGGFIKERGKLVNKGLSLYFGSRQSPAYFNFYQKDYELAKEHKLSVEMAQQQFGIKNRYEVRLSDEKAFLLVEYLLSTGESLEWLVKELIDTNLRVFDADENGLPVTYSENWRKVIQSMSELRLTVKPEKPNYDKSLRWLSHYLAPTLKKIYIMDKALGKNELMERIEQAELKNVDEIEIEQLLLQAKDLILRGLTNEQNELQVELANALFV